ncbi:2OG-Fe(II) oxygenase [Streptomyces sp. NPDC021093]|uniref:2OG-Fe(II) oxygenase n=1 Tax=Streptomyces sp. NPDC021093 TaxID=3365112 RepID=UPI003788E442
MYDEPESFRSTVTMARHRFGEGSCRHFANPLPDPVPPLRQKLYLPLARIANTWAARPGEPGFRFPERHEDLLTEGRHRPTPLLLRYEESGYN